jgi:hypothetical protein
VDLEGERLVERLGPLSAEGLCRHGPAGSPPSPGGGPVRGLCERAG